MVEIEAQLSATATNAAERHLYLSGVIVEATTPAVRDGFALLDRVGREESGVQGFLKVVGDT